MTDKTYGNSLHRFSAAAAAVFKFLFDMKHDVTAVDYSCCNESNLYNVSQ